MDNSKFSILSLQDNIELIINSLQKNEKPDLAKMLTATALEKFEMISKSLEAKKNPNYYFTASLTEQIPHIIKQIEQNKKAPNMAQLITGNFSDYAKLIEESVKNNEVKPDWLFSQPFETQIKFMLKQIEKEAEEKRIVKLEEVKLYITALENTKAYIKAELIETPLNETNEINGLLERLFPIMEKLEEQIIEQEKLTKK